MKSLDVARHDPDVRGPKHPSHHIPDRRLATLRDPFEEGDDLPLVEVSDPKEQTTEEPVHDRADL